MIDSHCHLTYDGLFERVDDVLQAARAAGVTQMITVGTTPADAEKAVALAQREPDVFATVGVHPHYAQQWTDQPAIEAAFDRLTGDPRVVAIGEMGLDRHYPDPPIALQKQLLDWQLAYASTIDLPIVIHNREATDETIDMLKHSGIAPERFVFHCFTGMEAELDAILEFGAAVGLTGIVTFRSAPHLAACAQRVPDNRLLVETDSPYLTPEPHRKVRPNEPRYVMDVGHFVARQRGMSVADFEAMTDANARRIFRLPTIPKTDAAAS